MHKILITAGLAALIAGCQEERPSPFLGTWVSGGHGTGASYRLQESGKCRYMLPNGTGTLCEWEQIDDKTAIITRTHGNVFVESEVDLLGKEIYVTTPSADSFDIFQKQ